MIMFDMNNRESFDNLNEEWLGYLRTAYYTNQIFILGNYADAGNRSSLLTTNDEIKDMVGKSQTGGKYLEIGNKANNEIAEEMDGIIYRIYEDEAKKNKCSGSRAESFKIDRCNIF